MKFIASRRPILNLIVSVWLLLLLLFFSGFCVAQTPALTQSSTAITEAIRTHQTTCLQIINNVLERIKKYNLSVDGHVSLNALTEINPYILEEARTLDQTFAKTHQLLGPLHCVPVVIKDNIDSSEMTTTAGSLALLGTAPVHDAPLVARLREAGALILGKGTMDEFAWGMMGISSRSGRTGNAYDPNQNPGGSSSGPAVAVAAHFAVMGIGTDNSGSVRIPAAFNGLVGLRPSMGLINHKGIFPMGNLDGTAGPMAYTVEEVAKTLDIITDPHQQPYTTFLQKEGLQGKRIGIVHTVGDVDVYQGMPATIRQLIQQAQKTMQQAGAMMVDPIDLPAFDHNRDLNQTGEIKDVNQYLAAFPATRQSFQDICLSDRSKIFGSVQDCLQFIQKIAKAPSSDYQKALSVFKKNKNYVEHIMRIQHLDALLIPISTSGSATYDTLRVNTGRAPVSSNAGLPSLEMPIGLDTRNQLPVGIELVGKKFEEGPLIAMAYAYQLAHPLNLAPPIPNENVILEKLSIATLNHLFTLLGNASYEQVLKYASSDQNKANRLTPLRFQQIVQEQTNLLEKK